jgi:hypothetical protein
MRLEEVEVECDNTPLTAGYKTKRCAHSCATRSSYFTAPQALLSSLLALNGVTSGQHGLRVKPAMTPGC